MFFCPKNVFGELVKHKKQLVINAVVCLCKQCNEIMH